LWNNANTTWIGEREKDWRRLENLIFRSESPRTLRDYRRYFIEGRSDGRLTPIHRVLMTPFDSKETARKVVLESNHFVGVEIEQILSNYFTATSRAANAEFYRDHAQIVVAAFFSDGYKKEYWRHKSKSIDVSPEPTGKVRNFIGNYILLFKQEIDYSGNIDCLNYFCSCIPFAKNVNQRSSINKLKRFEKLFALAEEATINNHLSVEVIKFAESLLERREKIIEDWNSNEKYDRG